MAEVYGRKNMMDEILHRIEYFQMKQIKEDKCHFDFGAAGGGDWNLGKPGA